MVNLIVSLIFAILLLIFASQNMHEVEVRFVFGEPVEMPMILAIAGAFICGFALAIFNFILRKSKSKDSMDDY
ncbi:MAG: lipopolysaccharide assembly protein LapA domain-containing protein [Magnetococcus sp. DMHC-6]